MATLHGAVCVHDPVVNGSKRGGGKGREDPRVSCDRFRNGLAADQTGRDELISVGTVHLSAGSTSRSPPIAAGHQQPPVRLVQCGVPAEDLPGDGIYGRGLPDQFKRQGGVLFLVVLLADGSPALCLATPPER
jgi:hypothetical protein